MLVSVNCDIILCLNYDEIIGGTGAKSRSWGSYQQFNISRLCEKTDSIYQKRLVRLRLDMNGNTMAFNSVSCLPGTVQSQAWLEVFCFCF